MEVRQLAPCDKEMYLKLLHEAEGEDVCLYLSDDAVDGILDDSSACTVGLVSDGTLLAVATVLYDKYRWAPLMEAANVATGSGCELCNVVVHPHYRRLGLGEIIIKMATAIAQKHGCEYMFSAVDVEDVPMFKILMSVGARRQGTSFSASGEALVVYCKRIRAFGVVANAG